MKYVPHDYQAYATDFILAHPEAAVLLDMGLGKSVITLTAIQKLCLDAFEISRVLVIAPLRVARDTWPAELQKWDHLQGLSYSVAVGNEKERLAALMRPAFLHIINRENVQWLVEDSGLPFRYDMIVIDELSSFKSWQAKRFKSLLKVRPSVKRIVGLTGTPSSNGLMDLWAEFRLLDMGQRLGRFITRYREAYFVPDKRSMQQIFSYKPRPGAEDEIYRKIGDIAISMRATDHLKMPECIMNRVLVGMSEDEQQVYDQMKEQLIVQVKGKEIDAVNAAALSGKLCQMANGAVYTEEKDTVQIHDRKLDALEDLIEGANGKPLLVAYWFKHDLKRIQERFPAAREIRTSKDITDWNDGRISLAVIHPASAGHGLNLQAGGSRLMQPLESIGYGFSSQAVLVSRIGLDHVASLFRDHIGGFIADHLEKHPASAIITVGPVRKENRIANFLFVLVVNFNPVPNLKQVDTLQVIGVSMAMLRQ